MTGLGPPAPQLTRKHHEGNNNRFKRINTNVVGYHIISVLGSEMTADLIPLDDCIICGGRGWYKQYMGDAKGMPAWETIHCDCHEEREEKDDATD